jgi:hypothetical protein
MRPKMGEFECLRLAAKAADREKAARQLGPVFEERLTRLGYSQRAMHIAFTVLSGSGTVAEALEALALEDFPSTTARGGDHGGADPGPGPHPRAECRRAFSKVRSAEPRVGLTKPD